MGGGQGRLPERGGVRWRSKTGEEKQALIGVNTGSEEQRVAVEPEGQRGPLLNGRAA